MPAQNSIPDDFTAVVEENQASLRYYIRSLGVQAAWVDDIAQECFLLLLKKWGKLEHTDQLDCWLRTAARNLVRNELRKSSRRPHLINRYLTTLILQHDEKQPREVVEMSERREALESCLTQLTERTRRAIDEFYVHNKTSQEIGKELQMSPAAVRSMLCRARETLAFCIEQQTH